MLELADGADDQAVLAAALRTGRVTHFAWQQPTLVELFREAVAAPTDAGGGGMSEPRTLGSAALVRLVAAREISARVRDKNFIISSVVIIVLLLGTPRRCRSRSAPATRRSRIGVVGDVAALEPALEAQGEALDVDVAVVELDDEAAATAAIEDEDVDGVLVAESGQTPELLVQESAGGSLQAVVQGAVAQLSLAEQLVGGRAQRASTSPR